MTIPRIARVAEREAVVPATATSHWRILVVEDNEDAATTLTMLLEQAGHAVAHAADAATALQKTREFHPQVILSDIGLGGGMNGYDLARTIGADRTLGDPYLIAVTGYGQEADRHRAEDAGFAVHLIKPVDPRTLERVLANIPPRAD